MDAGAEIRRKGLRLPKERLIDCLVISLQSTPDWQSFLGAF